MKTIKINPGAKRLMESLRDVGYEFHTAVADLVDNSINAQATEIHIDITPRCGNRPATVSITDNGVGMDKEQLKEAMRYGSHLEYAPGSLGKYGLGLKTASSSQCRCLTVSSKSETTWGNRRYCMRWDVDHVYQVNEWELMDIAAEDLLPWEKVIMYPELLKDSCGTVVLWQKLEETLSFLSYDEDNRNRDKLISQLVNELIGHLRMVFHRFLQGTDTGYRKTDIYVCGVKITPWDPFCRAQPATKELPVLKIPVETVDLNHSKVRTVVTISPYVLPSENEFTDFASWKDASGPKKWNLQQGLYFYRNSRLIKAGGWSHIRSPEEHVKLLRIAVDFPDDLDRIFSIDISKMKAGIPKDLVPELKKHITDWVKIARDRYDKSNKTGTRFKEVGSLVIDQKADKSDSTNVNVDISKSAETVIVEADDSLCIVGNQLVIEVVKNGNGLSIVEDDASGGLHIKVPKTHPFSSTIASMRQGNMGLENFSFLILSILEELSKGNLHLEKIPISDLKLIYQNIS